MERRDKILKSLDVAAMKGLEIGPRDKPIVKKTDGEIRYVDYMDADGLKELHRSSGVTDCNYDNIVDVDVIWGSNTIAEGIGTGEKFDYVIASHVVEHVPDLISWLGELSDILKENGVISLAVPDKRYCFDHLRDESSISDVITAYFVRARRPQPQQVIDFCLHFHAVDTRLAWAGAADRPELEDLGQLDHALAMAQSSIDGVYQDVHCWAFTPNSFSVVMDRLFRLNLLNLQCDAIEETEPGELEFFVTLRKKQAFEQNQSVLGKGRI